MRINAMNSQMKLQGMKTGSSSDSTSIEQKIEQLRKQLQQIKENQQLSPEEKEKRINNIQKQIDHLERQKAEASKENDQKDVSSVQSEKIQDMEKAILEEQAAAEESSAARKKRFDTFEHQPETQKAGLYELSHDEKGNAVIKFDDPAKDSESKLPNENHEDAEKPQIVKTTLNTDAVDHEIEKLKQSISETRQKLSSASDPKEKESLENKLSQLESEVKQKDNDTYRRQHMQITEQITVSKVGE